MAKKDQSISVKDTVYKLQLSLLEGIQTKNQLYAAGSLISRKDYEDVVTERSIVNLCGYPLCANSLLSDRPHKGRYRISLKEHKVYDLRETYMYCSTNCVVDSRAFAASLEDERCSVLNPAKVDEVMRLFGNLSLEEGFRKNEDLGLSKLKIQENLETKVGEVSLDDWVGQSNAIEGYVPQRDRKLKPPRIKNRKEGSNDNDRKLSSEKDMIFTEMDFASTVIIGDEYNISKTGSTITDTIDINLKSSKGKVSHKDSGEAKLTNRTAPKDNLSTMEVPSTSNSCQTDSIKSIVYAERESCNVKVKKLNETLLKSSLKTSGAKKLSHSVTWADENSDSVGSGNLCEVREIKDTSEGSNVSVSMKTSGPYNEDGENISRFASAEACAMALSQAAEAVASGEADVTDAVSEAGIIILPSTPDVDEGELADDVDEGELADDVDEGELADDVDEGELTDDVDMHELDTPVKWPRKPGTAHSDLLDSENSWYNDAPEGFNLTLSPFANMWMALFAWMTSSSLAYIYGRDESFHEEYLSVNGREYPQKIVLGDGRSSEIKQTLAGCLARALPGLVVDLKLPTPISTLEQGMGRLLDTMSFIDAVPAFRMKQWQVVVLLFIEALSVSRIPALTPYLTNRRILLHKVLDGAISAEEYEVMKDLMIPLGRAPSFSAQSGA